MEVIDSYENSTPAEWAPNQEHLNREAALRRFNALFVYGPLTLALLICLALLGWLLWAAVIAEWFTTTDPSGARALASGLADTLFIIMALPWALLCPLLPIGFIAGIFYSRKKGQAPLRRLQRLFWRLDTLLHAVDARANAFIPHIAHYVVAGNAIITRLQTTTIRLFRRHPHPPEGPETTTPSNN